MKLIQHIVGGCILLFLAADAQARCGEPPRVITEEYLRKWSIIAYGRVIETHNDLNARHNSYAILELEGIWQGEPPNPLKVYHSDSAHGFQFEPGGSYLVFAGRRGGRIEASICGPTCREDQCLTHLGLLGDPTSRP